MRWPRGCPGLNAIDEGVAVVVEILAHSGNPFHKDLEFVAAAVGLFAVGNILLGSEVPVVAEVAGHMGQNG